jgi:hypothetical protein
MATDSSGHTVGGTAMRQDPAPNGSTPRWVKVFGVAALSGRDIPMNMAPWLRKFALTAHVTFSVGWFGAVAAFLALAIAGIASSDAQLARGAYLAMRLTTWSVIVPLAFLSLASGVISSLGTSWGLLRYYWVLVKLLVSIFITIVLLTHLQPIDLLATVATRTSAIKFGAPNPAAGNGNCLQRRPHSLGRAHGIVGV